MFEESTEFYQYMSTIDDEKMAFKRLMEAKERLCVELRDYKEDREVEGRDRKQAMENTRKGGLLEIGRDVVQRDVIVVDSREFSSMTPIYLHEKEFCLIPMVLTVGDYVISDDI